LLCYF